MDTTITPPLLNSDLHRLQLTYQALTPVSSNASGSSEELEYPCYSDYQSHSQAAYQHQYNPLPPQYTHQQYPQPQHHHQHQHQHYAQTAFPYQHPHPYFKSEYAGLPIRMADIPPVPQDVATKAEQSDDDGRPGVHEMDQDAVDAIIRNKRKVRDPKACYACHRRKVKCDRNLPCDSCVKRDHPELCSYERPTKKRRLALSNALAQADGGQGDSAERVVNSGPNVTVPKEQWERMNQELNVLRAQVKDEKDDVASVTDEQSAAGTISQSDDVERGGVHAQSNQMGTMHVGSRSVLAYMIGNRSQSTQDKARKLLEENILPNLGLDNETTTYPFVDLWSADNRNLYGLIETLPDDAHCREYWLTYRDIPCIIYPVVPDAQVFEQTLNRFLQNRAESRRTGAELDSNHPYGVTLPWLALLFAVLASGTQSTGRHAKERELTSQVYICCSYEALRMSNFLIHPSLETIMALLIIGNALSYNMNPGVSYVLLGMTLRSAFSMGLHVSSPNFSEQEAYLRSRIWWALAWQDSHFSVSYDRPSSSILCTPALPLRKDSTPGNRSYVESMTAIIRLTQEILRERNLNPKQAMSWAMITKYKDEVHRIWQDAMPRLRDRGMCVAMTDHLERLALQIHCSYLISEICRPSLKEDHLPKHQSQQPHPGVGKQSPTLPTSATRRKSSLASGSPTPSDLQAMAMLREECIKFLRRTVETYVELRDINKFAARSWVGIQRSISAAFLLAVLPETHQNPVVVDLLMQLEKSIEQAAVEDSGFTKDVELMASANPDWRRLSSSTEQAKASPLWVKSMTKCLSALSKLNGALASGQSGVNGRQMATPTGFHSQPQPQTAAMYNTPVTSPGSGLPSSGMPLNMQQYPVIYNTQPRSTGMHTNQNVPPMSTMGPFTPDSAVSDWTFGNIPERALEYVHPGLWG